MTQHFERLKLPIGIENFEEIRREGFYYVDKTAMIRELLENWGKVNLFTRPRRFGKSLNMSMLRSFLEIGGDKTLFDDLEISGETELCQKYQGRFPVISISLKSISAPDFASARSLLCSVIGDEAVRFHDLLESKKLSTTEKDIYRQLIAVDEKNNGIYTISDAALSGSLKTLSSLLYKHFGEKVIILIDEYDVPLAKANENGYYDQMVSLIRNIFEQALKTNDCLYFAVLTGCLRVSKESIFTGLNNPRILSVTTVRFDEYFGFTDNDVRDLLSYYGLESSYDSIKNWYDGYRFGNVDVYCPWDVISYCDELLSDPDLPPRDYWSNTSSNNIIRSFIEMTGDGLTKRELENLIAGENVIKEIHEDLTYNTIYDSPENLWSVLFATGYLTQRGRTEDGFLKLTIPNLEIRRIFIRQIMTMFRNETQKDGITLQAFCHALSNGNAREVERLFNLYLSRTISIRDTFARRPLKENFYHGILLGILSFKGNWYIQSNAESGNGYSDILIESEDGETGIIIEVKYAEQSDLEQVCRSGLEQIRKKDYAARLRNDGAERIFRYSIACFRKRCRVMVEC